jgi:hypothetical protein
MPSRSPPPSLTKESFEGWKEGGGGGVLISFPPHVAHLISASKVWNGIAPYATFDAGKRCHLRFLKANIVVTTNVNPCLVPTASPTATPTAFPTAGFFISLHHNDPSFSNSRGYSTCTVVLLVPTVYPTEHPTHYPTKSPTGKTGDIVLPSFHNHSQHSHTTLFCKSYTPENSPPCLFASIFGGGCLLVAAP